MAERPTTTFEYIAFDDISKAVLAHGATAVDALLDADQIAPDSPIHILDAGRMGWEIWTRRMNLVAARTALENQGLEPASAWLLGREVKI